MSTKKRVLLLVGSAKQPHSTSESLGTYLIEKLQGNGFETETLFIHKSINAEDRRDKLLAGANDADIIVMAFPLYVDCLPYLVIRTMELIAKNREEKANPREQSLLCIVNSGFPEAHQNDTAIAICRKFAQETGFKWAGGLALGGGEAIKGRPLLEVKGMARNAIKSLDLAADSLAGGKPVSQKAIQIMAKPFIPKWIYILLGGMRWNKEAKRHGVHKKLSDRPYSR
jgi:hypothetical protein